MSDNVTIKYGDSNLNLTKSDSMVAVKFKPGTEARTMSSFAPQLSNSENKSMMLGGFRLLHIKDAADSNADDALNVMRTNNSVIAGTHVYTTSDDNIPFVPTGELYVEFNAEAPSDKIQHLLGECGLQIIEARSEHEFIVKVTSESVNPIKTAAFLQNSPLVKVAEPDLATPSIVKNFVLPTDELLQNQWHLKNIGIHRGTAVGFKAGADANVVAAWQYSKSLGDPSVIVALIDDGFDISHPDFSGEEKIVAPIDFTRNSSQPLPDMLGEDWHGTACAGVAVGNADSKGIVGAAPHCRLMPIRWGRDLSDREIENWFGWAREQGAAVVSCSWGAAANVFKLSTRASHAISRCAREGRKGLGCVICFAAGNDNHDINDPKGVSLDGFAIHPDVIAVAACNSCDKKSDYSNYGKEITICAPSSGAGGWGILTTDVIGRFVHRGIWYDAGYSPGAFTENFGGTSSACPLVAGICGLLISIKPTMMALEVKQILKQSARKIGDQNSYDNSGHSIYHGYGCIDALAAVKLLASA